VKDLGAAGIYSADRAQQILARANVAKTNECAIPFECVMGPR
jgi:hypothetical protein